MPSVIRSCGFVVFDTSSVSHKDSRLPQKAALQLRLIQQPKQASNVFLVWARMCCVWAGRTYVWNAGRGTDWQVWAQAGRARSEEHVAYDISNIQGLRPRAHIQPQRWIFLPAECSVIYRGRHLNAVFLFVRYFKTVVVLFCFSSVSRWWQLILN